MTNSLANKSILIVDDSISIRHLLKGILRAGEFDSIIESGDGQQALKALGKGEIGLIICDWEMPNMNGIELFEAIMNDKILKNIPFILLTAQVDKKKVTEALTKGIKNYIIKPFTPEAVINKVKEVLK